MIKTIPYTIKAENKDLRNPNQKIPYTIIQTMKTNKVPIDMYNAAMSWVEKNPEYDYEFFDNERCEQFLKDNYPPTIYHCFNMIYIGAAKADLFRWAVINIKGGIYLDIDCQAIMPIRNFINENDQFVTCQSSVKAHLYRLNHALLASIPQFILLSKSIDNAISNILIRYNQKRDEYLPQDICGPAVLGKTLNILKKKPITKFHNKYKNNIVNLNFVKIRLIPKEQIIKYLIPKYKNYLSDCEKNNFERYNKEKSAFYYSYANEYVIKNNVKLDYSLINEVFV